MIFTSQCDAYYKYYYVVYFVSSSRALVGAGEDLLEDQPHPPRGSRHIPLSLVHDLPLRPRLLSSHQPGKRNQLLLPQQRKMEMERERVREREERTQLTLRRLKRKKLHYPHPHHQSNQTSQCNLNKNR